MFRRLLSYVATTVLAAGIASATWSIVVVNTRTGEVCVASATCIQNFDLQRALCVMRVGEGAAACQSFIDQSGQNRIYIWSRLQQGLMPSVILDGLAHTDAGHQTRQYGIVSLRTHPATFTGTQCGQAAFGVTGESGEWKYSIQGNVLTDMVVVQAAEAAFLASSGDLGTRVMAGMVAARALGGDGRCSCSPSAPTSCGAPPPGNLVTARCSFLCISRMGDVNGVCNSAAGCANGQYYCNVKVITPPPGTPDAVDALVASYAVWRAGAASYADHLLTTVQRDRESMPATGASLATVDVQLVNLEGQPVTSTPATLAVVPQGQIAESAVASAPIDLGAGHFRFTIRSGLETGIAHWKLVVQHPGKTVRLWPSLEMRFDPPVELHSGFDTVSAGTSTTVPLALDLGAARAGDPYLVLGTTSGTVPGFAFQGVHMPLNRDRFLVASAQYAGTGAFPNTAGALDVNGRAECAFISPPASPFLSPGTRVDWAALVGSGANAHVTNVASFVFAP